MSLEPEEKVLKMPILSKPRNERILRDILNREVSFRCMIVLAFAGEDAAFESAGYALSKGCDLVCSDILKNYYPEYWEV